MCFLHAWLLGGFSYLTLPSSWNKTKSMEPGSSGFASQGVPFTFKNCTWLTHLDICSCGALALLSLLSNIPLYDRNSLSDCGHTYCNGASSALVLSGHYNKQNTPLDLLWICMVKEKYKLLLC